MARLPQMNQTKIASLQLACHYWEIAKMSGKADGKRRTITGACYNKAYNIFLREMGADNSMTLELRKEMTEYFSSQAVSKAAVRTNCY